MNETDQNAASLKANKRRERVKTLYFVNRLGVPEIMRTLEEEGYKNIADVTIRRDISKLRRELVKEISKESAEKLIARIAEQNDELIKKAWVNYFNAESVGGKVKCLQLIHDIDRDSVGLFQDLGLIEKASERTLQTVNMNLGLAPERVRELVRIGEEEKAKLEQGGKK
jgi:hypothetical protein